MVPAWADSLGLYRPKYLFPQFTSLAPASSTEEMSQAPCLEKKVPPETWGYDYPAKPQQHPALLTRVPMSGVCVCAYT